ncbi:MAG TPA: hypothetical protein VNA25_11430 [Phycisphaerae bacterium]|nr:hypothetical protein [Phycisphaerae bacterium]
MSGMQSGAWLSCAAVGVLVGCLSSPAWGADWTEVQQLKRKYLQMAAKNAMAQQKTDQAPPVAIPLASTRVELGGGVKHVAGPADSVPVEVTAAPKAYRRDATEFIRVKLAKPMDMVSAHSGLAMTVKTEQGAAPEVRLGCRLIASDGNRAIILPIVPIVSPWGDATHEVYLDWAFLNYRSAEQAVKLLKNVETIEITFASALRAPKRGATKEPRPAKLTISNLRVVDYLKGSYDPSRRWLKFDDGAGKWTPGERKDLTLQHRCQEVTGIVAGFGGQAGLRSAIDALDMAVRTQCWDGSFLDGRRGAVTVASGEYTFGFTIYGLLCGYQTLEDKKAPALDEKMTVGPATMMRREFYQRMFYRGAMSRTAATPKDYRDDIIGGNTLITGANRVLGYAIAMRMVAEVLTDPARKKAVMTKYQPYMQGIADAQGKFSGGFPVLGEGNKFKGKGIHYDAGYTRTHMDWLVLGVRRTDDPLLVQMLKRYQTVFVAAMDSGGDGILPMISERHQGTRSVQLILPDATYQVGVKHKLPIVAQWGYNVGMPVWRNWEKRPGNHFTFASHTRGYSLGAHTSILVDDMAAEPVPEDLGYLFPRQFPIWSTRLYTKAGKLVRTSRMYIHPDGTQVSDYQIEVGEVPATVGVPVKIVSPKGKVIATADKLTGWPKLLPAGAEVKLSGDVSAKGKLGEPIALTLKGKTRVVITGPEVQLPPAAGGGKEPFRAELTLEPEKPGQAIELTVLRGTVPYKYKTIPPHVLAGLPAGANVALARNGAKPADVSNRTPVGILTAMDGDLKNFCVIDSLATASFRIELAMAFPLAKAVIYSGQYGKIDDRSFPRPKDVSISVPGRQPIKATLTDAPFEPQEFDLGGATADSVKIEVHSVYPASKASVDWGGFAEIELIRK